jgi:hypothetical protein
MIKLPEPEYLKKLYPIAALIAMLGICSSCKQGKILFSLNYQPG